MVGKQPAASWVDSIGAGIVGADNGDYSFGAALRDAGPHAPAAGGGEASQTRPAGVVGIGKPLKPAARRAAPPDSTQDGSPRPDITPGARPSRGCPAPASQPLLTRLLRAPRPELPSTSAGGGDDDGSGGGSSTPLPPSTAAAGVMDGVAQQDRSVVSEEPLPAELDDEDAAAAAHPFMHGKSGAAEEFPPLEPVSYGVGVPGASKTPRGHAAAAEADLLWCRFCGKSYTTPGWLARHEAVCEEVQQAELQGHAGGRGGGRGRGGKRRKLGV